LLSELLDVILTFSLVYGTRIKICVYVNILSELLQLFR